MLLNSPSTSESFFLIFFLPCFQDYPGEEILIVYDPDFAYGQNFFMCLNEEAKERYMGPTAATGGAEGGEGG